MRGWRAAITDGGKRALRRSLRIGRGGGGGLLRPIGVPGRGYTGTGRRDGRRSRSSFGVIGLLIARRKAASVLEQRRDLIEHLLRRQRHVLDILRRRRGRRFRIG